MNENCDKKQTFFFQKKSLKFLLPQEGIMVGKNVKIQNYMKNNQSLIAIFF